MSSKFDIMAAGHLCIDIIPEFPDTGATEIGDIMAPGKLVNVGNAKIGTGGPVSNTGIAMKVLGSSACFCARVGDDQLGKMTIDMLRKEGNADGIHIARGSASSYTVVVAPPGMDRIFLHSPGTNDEFSSRDLDPDLIAKCRHFHMGYPPVMRRMFSDGGTELQQVFRIAKEAGATTSCDMTLPDPGSASGKADWRAILKKTLPYVDLFLPSIEETFFMLEPETFLAMKARYDNADLIDYLAPEDYSRIAGEVLGMGPGVVALKTGHRGFYLKTSPAEAFERMGRARPGDAGNWSERELWAPAFVPSRLVSATGSGDSAIAGLLSAFLRGLSIEQALKYATCCGLQNVLVLDGLSGIRSWSETTEMIEQKMPMIDARIEADGWKFSEEHRLWSGPDDRPGD